MDQKIVMPKIEKKLFYKGTYRSGEDGEWKRINRLGHIIFLIQRFTLWIFLTDPWNASYILYVR